MFTTITLATVFIGLLLALAVLWALCLRLGLRWAKASNVTTRRVVGATAAVLVLQIALNVAFLFAALTSDTQSLSFGVVELVAGVIMQCVVIGAVFRVGVLRALRAWFPTPLASVAIIAFALLVLRPLLYETFVVSTNAMAPTLLGRHWRDACPRCGQPAYCSPVDGRYVAMAPPRMICDGFHVTQSTNAARRVHSGDHCIVAKFLAPRRWDSVVFQCPEDPATLYVMRLVGLPGETVHLEGGSVWVDGEKQTPPDSIRGVQYLSRLPDWPGPDPWGSRDRPATLSEGEYFVLGDFSARS